MLVVIILVRVKKAMEQTWIPKDATITAAPGQLCHNLYIAKMTVVYLEVTVMIVRMRMTWPRAMLLILGQWTTIPTLEVDITNPHFH